MSEAIIELNIDAAKPLALLNNGAKRMAFAVANAVNATAKHVQSKQHQNVRDKFTIRNERFMFGTAARPGGAAGRISMFASAGLKRFQAIVEVRAGSQASERRLLLPQFETGGKKLPRSGAQSVAVPLTGSPARPSKASPVAKDYTFAGMRLQAFQGGVKLTKKSGRRGKVSGVGLTGEFGRISLPDGNTATQWKGRNRTFLLQKSSKLPHGGVLQRTGKKRGDIRAIYVFRTDVPLDNRLDFKALQQREAPPFLQKALKREVDSTLAYNLTGIKV